MSDRWDLVVIGGGPGGYVAALRAARLGLKVVIIDQAPLPGGTCLHHGCIPSKTLLEDGWKGGIPLTAMMEHKAEVVQGLAQGIVSLFKKYRVTWMQGIGKVVQAGQVVVQLNQGGEEISLSCQHILLALGSRSRPLAELPVDGVRILDSGHALSLDHIPRSLLILGGGAIGLEMASLWSRLGTEVILLEAMEDILPGSDATIVRHVRRLLQKQGISFQCGIKVLAMDKQEEHISLTIQGSQGGEQILTADYLLVAVGRQANVNQVSHLHLAMTEGRLQVNDHFQTSLPGIYALGDVIPGPMLAHRAMAEGVRFAELLANHRHPAPVAPIPSVVYTHPEVAAVGMSEAQAKQNGYKVRCGQAFFTANPRARCINQAEGVVKVVADEESGLILGVHMVGPGVSELVVIATAALQQNWHCRTLGGVVFPHPSLGETLKEAALAVLGEAVHL